MAERVIGPLRHLGLQEVVIMVDFPTLRVARPSDDLDALLPFYCQGLGLTVLHRFEDHSGFDGVILGQKGAPYHLEFTHARGHRVGRAPTRDNLLVFYIPEVDAWQAAITRMREAGFDPVLAFNPYWHVRGATFEDPDGYRIVIERATWTP